MPEPQLEMSTDRLNQPLFNVENVFSAATALSGAPPTTLPLFVAASNHGQARFTGARIVEMMPGSYWAVFAREPPISFPTQLWRSHASPR